MRVSHGKKTVEMDGDELAEKLSGHAFVAVDLGTGRGHFPYQLARRNPHLFCIGIDPVAANVEKNARRTLRKPSRGGLPNLIYVIASAEELPHELAQTASQVFVLFPWGSLLKGLLACEEAILDGIASICRPCSPVEIIINRSLFRTPVAQEVESLPEPSEAYIRDEIAPRCAKRGLMLVESKNLRLSSASPGDLPVTLWARRLSGDWADAAYLRLYRRGRVV